MVLETPYDCTLLSELIDSKSEGIPLGKLFDLNISGGSLTFKLFLPDSIIACEFFINSTVGL